MPIKTLIITFNPLETLKKKDSSNFDAKDLYIKYFDNLETCIQKFEEKYSIKIDKLYNKYAQEIPLNYNVQKTGLNVYY